MKKDLRNQVYEKYDGRCAYCGKELSGLSAMQVDHINPILRGRVDYSVAGKPEESIDTLNPACARCNRYKSVMSVEQFRHELSQQAIRSRCSSKNFRLAEDFGLIVETGKKVEFYFEKAGPRSPLQRDESRAPGHDDETMLPAATLARSMLEMNQTIIRATDMAEIFELEDAPEPEKAALSALIDKLYEAMDAATKYGLLVAERLKGQANGNSPNTGGN